MKSFLMIFVNLGGKRVIHSGTLIVYCGSFVKTCSFGHSKKTEEQRSNVPFSSNYELVVVSNSKAKLSNDYISRFRGNDQVIKNLFHFKHLTDC